MVIPRASLVLGNRRLLALGAFLILAAVGFAAATAPAARAAAGDLDNTFGTGGTVTGSAMSGASDMLSNAALQSDGKIVVVGHSSSTTTTDSATTVSRYNANGTLDTSFGSGGIATITIAGGSFTGNDLAIQSDGKIVVAGVFRPTAGTRRFAVARLTSSGADDTGFGTSGSTTTLVGTSTSSASAVAIASDGKIVLGGWAHDASTNTAFAIVRYSSSGAPDASFGTSGAAVQSIGSTFDVALDIALDSSDRIVAAGFIEAGGGTAESAAIARFTSTGALDTSFGTSGKSVYAGAAGEYAEFHGVAIRGDGQIVAAGQLTAGLTGKILVGSFGANGAPSAGFGSGGYLLTNFGENEFGTSVALQPDNKILVLGGHTASSTAHGLVVRLGSDGSIDSTFGSSGKSSLQVAGGSTSWSGGVLQPDYKLVAVGSTNSAGNIDFALARISTFTDLIAPTVSITAPPALTNSTASKSIAFSASDNVSVALTECKLDSGGWSACASPYATGPLSAGSHTVSVRATDPSGNVGSSSVAFAIDITPPNLSVTQPASPTASAASQSVAFSASDSNGIAGYECHLDANSWSACSAPFATGALTEGSHTAYVRASDNAGNTTTSSVTIFVDLTDPSLSVDPPASPVNSAASQSITFSASDAGGIASTECKLDLGAWNSCTSPYATGALAEGTHSISVRVTDLVGHQTSGSVPLVIDLTPPSVSLSPPASPTASSASQTVAFSASDERSLASVECRVGSGAWAPCATPLSTGPLAEGVTTIEVRATDTAGNVTTDSKDIVVDQTEPTLSVTAPPAFLATADGTSLSFSAADASGIASTECQVDSGGWVACSSPFDSGQLTEGDHQFSVRVTDGAGNAATASASTRVDLTDPQLSITPPSTPTATGAGVDVAFSASDANGIQATDCQLDSGGWSSCSSPFSTGTLAEGTHTVSVRATDSAGRQATGSVPIVVDLTAPSISIDSPSSPTASAASQDVAFSVSDATGLASVTCAVDSATPVACASPFSTGALGEGHHTITVAALDTAGNDSSANTSIDVDLTDPSVSITPPASPTASSASQPVVFSASDANGLSATECRVDSDAWATCSSPFATGPLSEGSHTVEVRATDQVGRQSAASAAIVVDLTDPDLDVVQPQSPTNHAAGESIDFTASDGVGVAGSECRVDLGTWATCTTPFATGALPEGEHSVDVRTTDLVGHVTTRSVSFAVDLTAPAVSITAPPAEVTLPASLAIAFAASDAVDLATVECRLDDGAWSACASPFATGQLTAGSHRLEVRATDTAGNTNSAVASFTAKSPAGQSSQPGEPVVKIERPKTTRIKWSASTLLSGKAGPSGLVRRVDVALRRVDRHARIRAGRCLWYSGRAVSLRPHPRPRKTRYCRGPHWVRAIGTDSWHVRTADPLARGSYRLYVRVTLTDGARTKVFSRAAGTLRMFRVR